MTGIPSTSYPADRGNDHTPTLSYADFSGPAEWHCSCGAHGSGRGSPAVGWADHVAAVTRNNDIEGDV